MPSLPARLLTGSMTLRAEGAVAPAEAWDRYARPSRWSGWSPQIRSVETDGGDRLVDGLTGRVQGPGPVAVRFVVDEVDERSRTWAWTVHLGPLRLHLHHAVVARAGGGTQTTLRMRGPWPVLLGYAGPAQVALGRLVRP